MAQPPFQNIRLAPGQKLDQGKQQEVFDAIERNFEDAYNGTFASPQQIEELTKKIKAIEAFDAKFIAGEIEKTGTLTLGTGFTSEKVSTGIYRITLTTELPSVGTCVATPTAVGATASIGIKVIERSKKVFKVECLGTTFAAIDSSFTFIIKAA